MKESDFTSAAEKMDYIFNFGSKGSSGEPCSGQTIKQQLQGEVRKDVFTGRLVHSAVWIWKASIPTRVCACVCVWQQEYQVEASRKNGAEDGTPCGGGGSSRI